jgi:ectoine hydroxylase-related dioxygenase (phytanoyl-CoA dioxygenase family)
MPHPPTPVLASTIVMLDDFREGTGGTWVVPGSHLMAMREPEDFKVEELATVVAATAPAGR